VLTATAGLTSDYGVDAHTTLTVRVMSLDADLNLGYVLESITYDELLAGKNSGHRRR
jgi:hypothetical protein